MTSVLLVIGIGESTPGDSSGSGRWGGFANVLLSLTFATVGALVLARQPANRVGWVLCIVGVAVGIGDFAFQYADLALYGSGPDLPAGALAAWFSNLGLSPIFGLLALSLLLFPDGRLLSPRWRLAAALTITGTTFLEVGYALRAGPLDEPFADIDNRLGVAGVCPVPPMRCMPSAGS